ncbi:MAG: hypothetical protein HYX88_04395 [Chloroflexi bacterium]|nr:hypothetical protein [Chloroflexota bacterium]
MKCVHHPGVETLLTCGKCGQPICTRCVIQTPVGIRCHQCAQLKSLPTFDLSISHYLRAIGAGILLALVSGIAWSFFLGSFVYIWIALAVGYLTGEVVSLSVNRKRGTGLKIIAGTSVFLSYLISRGWIWSLILGSIVSGRRNTFGMMIGALMNPYALLMVAFGIFISTSRLR